MEERKVAGWGAAPGDTSPSLPLSAALIECPTSGRLCGPQEQCLRVCGQALACPHLTCTHAQSRRHAQAILVSYLPTPHTHTHSPAPHPSLGPELSSCLPCECKLPPPPPLPICIYPESFLRGSELLIERSHFGLSDPHPEFLAAQGSGVILGPSGAAEAWQAHPPSLRLGLALTARSLAGRGH